MTDKDDWRPIGTYRQGQDDFMVLVCTEGRVGSTLGAYVYGKYWHDCAEGDYRVTSPMRHQPTHWKPLPKAKGEPK